MNPASHNYVFIRDELLFSDGCRIYHGNNDAVSLSVGDRAVLNCVHRGEAEFGVLCRSLAHLEIGGDPTLIGMQLHTALANDRAVLALGTSPYTQKPDVIICDFDSASLPLVGSVVARRLRTSKRVLHVGLKQKVAHLSPDSMWLERAQSRQPEMTWFRFVQWARSFVRANERATLILLGHRDAVLFGDLTATVPSIVVLDPTWPSTVRATDLNGEHSIAGDPIEHLRALYYSLRFCPYSEFDKLNRTSSSALASLEMYALRCADVVCITRADHPITLNGVRPPHSPLIPACLPTKRTHGQQMVPDTLLVIADLDDGAEPLAPLLTLLIRLQKSSGPYDRLIVMTGDGRCYDVCATGSGIELQKGESIGLEAACKAVIVCPGLIRNLAAAARWMTSNIPSQILRSASSHPLQDLLVSDMYLSRVTVDTLRSRLNELVDESSTLRRAVLIAQARLARKWSVAEIALHLPETVALN